MEFLSDTITQRRSATNYAKRPVAVTDGSRDGGTAKSQPQDEDEDGPEEGGDEQDPADDRDCANKQRYQLDISLKDGEGAH